METEEIDEPFIEKSKHPILKTLLIIIIIAALAYGGYYYYTNYFNNPTEKVNTVITSLEDKLTDRLQSSILTNDKPLKINGLVKFNMKSNKNTKNYNAFNKMFNNLVIQINGQIDTKNMINNLDLASKINNEKLIDGKIYTENNKVYAKSDELLDKYILIGNLNKSNEKLYALEITDLTKLYNILVTTFVKNIDTKNATKNDEVIIVNGTKIEANRYNVVINGQNIIPTLKNILNDLKNNNEFVRIINKIDKDWLNDFEKTTNDSNNNNVNGIYQIDFYTKKDLMNEELIRISQTVAIEKEKIQADIDFIDDDTSLITLKQDDVNVSIKLSINNSIFNISIDGELRDMKISIEANFNYEEISSIQKEDVSNSVIVDELTEIEKEKIDDNLKKNNLLTDFLHNVRDYETVDNILPDSNQ